MAETERYMCKKSECSHLSFRTFTRYLTHVRNNHSHETNFKVTCPAEGCFRSYSLISSMRSHLRRKHKAMASQDDVVNINEDCSDFTDANECGFDNIVQFNHNENNENIDPDNISVRELALYALKTQELSQLSDIATDRVLESTSHLLQQNEENLKKRVRICLQNSGMNVRDINGLADVLESPPSTVEAMKELKTPADRNKYLKKKLHTVVSQLTLKLLCFLLLACTRYLTIKAR